MRVLPLFGLWLMSWPGAVAQITGSPAFEVASVKPHVPRAGEDEGSSVKGGPGSNAPGQITISNRPLRNLIIDAHGIHPFQIECPSWVSETGYDIIAKVPSGATKEDAALMMRDLLTKRFRVQIRRETRVLPAYALVLAKGGLKMRLSPKPAGLPDGSSGPSGIYIAVGSALGYRQPLARIADWLSGNANRPVVDATGLTGNYDFELDWSPNADSDNDAPALFVAIQQQLGLRAEPRKMGIEMLVVVSALRVPTEN